METFIENIYTKHFAEYLKKQEDLIMGILKKQPGFLSLEDSKHLIQLNRMVKDGEYIGTDYLFNGKVFLTIYPDKMEEKDGKFIISFDYSEY